MDSVQITYDAEVDAMYVFLTANRAPGIAVRQVPVDQAPGVGEIILDFDRDGRLLGMEIIGASTCVAADLLESIRSQRSNRPETEEKAPE